MGLLGLHQLPPLLHEEREQAVEKRLSRHSHGPGSPPPPPPRHWPQDWTPVSIFTNNWDVAHIQGLCRHQEQPQQQPLHAMSSEGGAFLLTQPPSSLVLHLSPNVVLRQF